MKKLFIILLIASVGLMGQDLKNRLNKMHPAANAAKLGNTIEAIKDALKGEEVLFAPVTISASGNGKALANTATTVAINGTFYSIPADTSTAFTATTHDVGYQKWGSYKLSVGADSTYTITMSASTYATADSAIDAIASTPANTSASEITGAGWDIMVIFMPVSCSIGFFKA